MATSKTAQLTDFTQDVLGRYTCNGFVEASTVCTTTARGPTRRATLDLSRPSLSGALTAC